MKGCVLFSLGSIYFSRVYSERMPASRELLVADSAAAGGGGLPPFIRGSEDDSG